LEASSDRSANVSLGDLNGDGHLDVVLAKGRHWPLVNRVLLGDGKGRFPDLIDLAPVEDRSYSGSLADLDGDGDLDVVISNDKPDEKRVYVNDGTGHFHPGSTYGRPEWATRNASVADLNGDGLPDVAVANRTGSAVGANYICLNRGAGTFDQDCVEFSRESATTISLADFNGDGWIDLAVPYRDGGQGYVYFNEPNADFTRLQRVPFGPSDATMRVARAADFDGDGLVDLVTIDQNHGVYLHFAQKPPSFATALSVSDRSTVPYALAVGDLNLDGAPDILVGNVEAASVAYFNDGTGSDFHPVSFGDDQGTIYGFAVGDVDEDGRPDIAAARSDAPNVLYFGGGSSSPGN